MKINNELKKLIEKNALALATISKNRKIHLIAVGDVKVVSKNQILIGDNFMRETLANIKRNNNVALLVWNKYWKKDCIGYELKGTVKYFTEGKWKKLIEKIHKSCPAKGAILVNISKIKKLA